MTTVSLVETVEGALAPEWRERAGAMFPASWKSLYPLAGTRGWTQLEPQIRLLALAGEKLVGQLSLVQPANRPRVLGIGDLIVDESWRGQGIGRKLIEQSVVV